MEKVVLSAALKLENFSDIYCYLGSVPLLPDSVGTGQNPSLDHDAADNQQPCSGEH